MCDGCCSVHLSLGRHVSQIKSLKKGSWCPQQLAMVHQLINSGANNIWEYTLLDPTQNRTARKKPTTKDPVHPTKADYIRAKYQFLTFVNKPKESEGVSVDDLSKQLHSSVRTSNLETSLRLLASGADPNYIHPEKGTSALHVAAHFNQPSQVELLLVYGADPGLMDVNGKIPLDVARTNNFTDLADRLVECQYELTDGLAYYLCKRRPDHKSGQHFINLEVSDGLDLSELAKGAKKKLQALSNHLFEELAMDVYDEVDRRENTEIWLSSSQPHTPNIVINDRQIVPFLPANPEFSATRNQGRQKLAKFSKREFATLIIDILNDAKRRYVGILSPTEKVEKLQSDSKNDTGTTPGSSGADPIYDQVYTEGDYAMIGEGLCAQIEGLGLDGVDKANQSSSSSKSNSSDEAVILKKSLQESQQQCRQLVAELEASQARCRQLNEELNILKTTVEKLRLENRVYRSFADSSDPSAGGAVGTAEGSGDFQNPRWTVTDRTEVQRQLNFKGISVGQDFPSPPQDLLMTSKSADFELKEAKPCHIKSRNQWHSADVTGSANESYSSPGSGGSTMVGEGGRCMPTQEEVVKKTEKITRALQGLFQLAQDNKHEMLPGSSEKIQLAVVEMMQLFPSVMNSASQAEALKMLSEGSERMRELCSKVPPDPAEAKCHVQRIIQTAYDIAKAAKRLVVTYE